eukprot:5808896-Karenia_brevis.AAC.1
MESPNFDPIPGKSCLHWNLHSGGLGKAPRHRTCIKRVGQAAAAVRVESAAPCALKKSCTPGDTYSIVPAMQQLLRRCHFAHSKRLIKSGAPHKMDL